MSVQFKDILEQLRTPSLVESFFYDPFEVTVYSEKNLEGEGLELDKISPIYTLQDVLRNIWFETNETYKNEFLPSRVFLAERKEDGLFYPVFYDLLVNNTKVGIPTIVDAFREDNVQGQLDGGEPFDIHQVDQRSGDRKYVVLEDQFPNWAAADFTKVQIPELHCFSYDALKKAYQSGGQSRSVESAWEPLFKYFFGAERLSDEISESQVQKETSSVYSKYRAVELLQNLTTERLEGRLTSPTPANVTSVKYVNLIWKETESSFSGVDVLFFEARVTKERPYMRYVPISGTPLTKLYQEDPLGLPYVHDPKLLKGWTDDRVSQLEQTEFLITKHLIREEQPQIPPIFATLYTLTDSTARFIIQPPKGIRYLDFSSDMNLLLDDSFADSALEGMPFYQKEVSLDSYTCVLRFKYKTAPKEDMRPILKERMEALSEFFKVQSSGLAETLKPFLELRYTGVSNFRSNQVLFDYIRAIREDEIQSNPSLNATELGTRIITRVIRGLQEEFEYSREDAAKLYQKYIEESSEVIPTGPDSQDFVPKVNTGITLLFKSQSPIVYDVHCYNINSLTNLQRITSILTYVFHATPEQWEEAIVEEDDGVQDDQPTEDDGVQDGQPAEDAGSDEEEEEEASAPAAKLILREDAPDPRGWYLNRLYALDAALFKPPNEAGKPKFSFVGKCQASDDRQPAGLTQDEFDAIKERYNSKRKIKKIECDKYVKFIIYGIPETAQMIEDAKGAIEVFTFMKYGSSSDPRKANYYTCPQYFCLRDITPLLEAEFKGTTAANGEPKPANTCPFCKGTKITGYDDAGKDYKPVKNQTVLERRPKPRKPQTAVGFLKSAGHPKGYDIPCCAVKVKHLLGDDERFVKYKPIQKKKLAKITAPPKTEVEIAIENAIQEQEEENQNEQEAQEQRRTSVDFELLRTMLRKEYVKDARSYPLDEGTIGCPQLAIDSVFGQKSTAMIKRSVVRQEFRPEAKGLFRVGVYNKPAALHDSFFSAIAPMLGLNTATEVANEFNNHIKVRDFISLNFGNLVMEFYDPTDTDNNGTPDEVNKWGRENLFTQPELVTTELSRLYNSYRRFKQYIMGEGDFTGKTKQMRHFVHALAEPGLITADGLTLMVLKYIGDPRSAEVQVQMKCPVLGLDIARYQNNRVSILTYSDFGIWEPMIYVDKIQRKNVNTAAQEGYYTIGKDLLLSTSFPVKIKDQYNAFTTQCRSAYRGAFTYQSGVDNRLLLPVAKTLSILSSLDPQPNGVVRDSYNHLVAITIPISGTDTHILVPVVDDGSRIYNNMNLKIYVSIDSVKLAGANEVYETYTESIQNTLYKYNKLYKLKAFIEKDGEIRGFQIGGITKEEVVKNNNDDTIEKETVTITYPTILLPCAPTSVTDYAYDVPPVESIDKKDFQFEYDINTSIVLKINTDDKNTFNAALKSSFSKSNTNVNTIQVKREEIENIYQHLRLTFSNWIQLFPQLKEFLTTRILENRKIPDFEKLKRLDIVLRSTVSSWLTSDGTSTNIDSVFVRRDCLKLEGDSKECTGYCTTKEGKCMIHIPETVEPFTEDATDYFCNRLFNEIARLPAMRLELMNKKVKRVQFPRTNVHTGDNDDQWILPETTPAWDKLLAQTNTLFTEKPQFYEEFSRDINTETFEEDALIQDIDGLEPLPESLEQFFTEAGNENVAAKLLPGEDPIVGILEYFGMYNYIAKREGMEKAESNKFGESEMFELCKTLKTPIIQISMDQLETFDDYTLKVFNTVESRAITSTTIIIPDYPVDEEKTVAAVIVTQDQLNPTIPLSYLIRDRLKMTTVSRFPKRTIKKIGGGYESEEGMVL